VSEQEEPYESRGSRTVLWERRGETPLRDPTGHHTIQTFGSLMNYKIETFPKTRIATFDICSIGIQKHKVAAMIEIDVSESREKIKKLKNKTNRISFTAWLIKVISLTIKNHELAAGYLIAKRKVLVFNDINVSIVIEKKLNDNK